MMRGARAILLAALAAAVPAGACRRTLETPDASTGIFVWDAAVRDAIVVADGPAPDAAIDRVVTFGVPRADPDAGICLPDQTTSLVCFGSDPAPYGKYLQPFDGGPGPGTCPTTRDFNFAGGESCGYVGCGPLLGSAVPDLPDAGAAVGDAGMGCCFVVAFVCGV
jgi:hypothetical protein